MYEEAGYAVVQRYSHWQKKKVRTIVVNSHSKNPSQKSIAGAIALAKPYDRIELTGGEYNESVAIQMPLELVASDGEDPHILSRSSTITIATQGIDVYMERLCISSRSSSKLDAAVVAIAGSPILFRCLCSSLLIGGSAVAHVDECTVKDSGSGVGIVVQDSGGGAIKSSTIRTHRHVCLDIDTRGELAVTECTIDNTTGGDAMVISGAVSSIARESGAAHTSCSRVEVAHCHFSISGEAGSGAMGIAASGGATAGGGGGGAAAVNVVGSACCIVLTQGAAPTIASNEFIEGEIGVLIEGPGTAQLKGNVIRCQRRCGILALVEEGFGYTQGHQTLRITGDNVLDRCRVGIDVQCASNRVSYAQQQSAAAAAAGASLSLSSPGSPADVGVSLTFTGNNTSLTERMLADELPNPKRAFAWAPVQGTTPPPCSRDSACFPPSTSPATPLVCVEGEWHALDKLRASLQQLVTMTLLAHPTCLQPSFGLVAGTAMTVSEGSSATSSNPFADVLNEMLGTQLSYRKDTASVQREMLQLRGNKGIDIVNTKFSNCDVCAIRFGRHGYGLVDECVFEDCGTYAIVVDCAAHPVITGCRFLRSRGASVLVTNFANPFIIGNEMASGKRDGIQLSGMSRGLIVGNIIGTHVGAGIRVDQHSQTLICANAISQNRKGGIAVANGSKPTILFNSLTANLVAQVDCTGGADAFISRNRITASPDAGLHIDSCSRCTVLSNTIHTNGDGVLVELDADPYVQDNDITANTRAGVRACNNALGVFVGNRILDNMGPNVLLTEGASPVFRANRIEGGAQGGVVVCSEGHGFFERNTIAGNAVANVLVSGAYSEPEFLRNVVCGSRSGCGVVCARNAGGRFLRNSIHENSECGVYVIEAANPTVRDNNIAREAVGVLVSDGGKGSFSHNVVQDCYGTGVLTQRQADPVFSENVVTGCRMSGLHIAPDSVGVFERNELTRNDIGVQLGSSMDTAMIELNSAYIEGADASNRDLSGTMSGTYRSGPRTAPRRSSLFATKTDKSVLRTIANASEQRRASAMRAAPSVVRGNTITANLRGGILLDAYPNGTVEQNEIFRNNGYGVRGDATYAAARAQSMLASRFGSPGGTSLVPPLLQSTQQPTFAHLQTQAMLRANSIHSHDEANVLLANFDGEAYETHITENAIYGAPYGVCVTHNSSLYEMRQNDVHTCLDGFAFASGGRGSYIANHVHDCAYSGVYVSDMGNPDFTDDNRVERCGFSGVFIDVGGQGTFLKTTVRHCWTGVVVFCGPTTPFQVSQEEVIKARILASTPTFVENVMEENELHGVLLLSVISGCPLRSPLVLSGSSISSSSSGDGEDSDSDALAHDAPTPYRGAVGGTAVVARGGRLCASFEKNVIRRNRVMGVYHDRFDHWDLAALDKAHAELKPYSPHAVKNAYGGYEVLLGTSQILDSEEHRRQRQLKQVSFVGNVITECSVGVGAGYGCHPYLQSNKIHGNTFFGLLLRFGSAVSAYGNDICGNGLAGVYAASGAKGYIAKGTIEANNGWCRPDASAHGARSFDTCPFHRTFLASLAAAVAEAEEKIRGMAAAATRPLRVCRRAYEQMSRLAEVHLFAMTDALRHLAELVAASSAGLTLATGCAPSSLFVDAAGSGGGGASVGRRLGGVAVADYADAATADGGMGVWVQAGSRVTIQGNRIANHRNSGVRVSRGVLQHHAILHRAFNMDVDKKPNARLDMVSKLPGSPKAAGEVAGAATVDIFAVQREAPPLACVEPGVLFTPQPLCAAGIRAAMQMAASATIESLDGSFTSFAHHSLSLSMTSKSLVEEKEQRLDSIHHAHVAGNVISGNKDGVYVEVFHRLIASPPTGVAATAAAAAAAAAAASTASSVGGSGKSRPGGVASSMSGPTPHAPPRDPRGQPHFQRASVPVFPLPASTATAEAAAAPSPAPPATPSDVAVMDCAYGAIDFTVVVEGNTVMQNQRHGIVAAHVSSVHCARWIANRGALNEAIAAQYEGIRAKLILSKEATRIDVDLPFELHAVKQKVGHALFRKNDVFSNAQTQAYVTSRCVALTADNDRTLLQLDTVAAPAESNYASQVLLGISAVAGLLQLPPPGVLLWEENRIRDGQRGVLLCGYLGPHSARFQRNAFFNIADDAFAVRGHLACATVGKGNVFERCGVGLRVTLHQRIRVAAAPATPLRTRIFQNVFKACKDSSLLLESVGETAPLVYRNEFTGHAQGTAALYLQSDATGAAAVVQGNVFSDNYTPVFLVGRGGSGAESTLTASRINLLENRFTCNYIGAIVCNGAFPTLERNLFDCNARAGLEVVGSGTRPQVRECVFMEHTRDSDSGASASKNGVVMRYPSQGTLLLQCRNFSLTLLPENARVLAATSQVRLPAGLLIGPFAEPVVEACAFVNNDVGVDAVRDAGPPAAAAVLTGLQARFRSCLFARHKVCGVLVRGSQGAGGGRAAAAPARTSTSGAADASRPSGVADATLFEQCAFTENAAGADGCGDVIAMEDGCATFSGNVFGGTVVGKAHGLATFAQNHFISLRDDGDGGSVADGGTATAVATAIVVQEGGRIVADRNTIARRKVGVHCFPGAEGTATGNRVVQCDTGLLLAPFNRTDVSRNRVLGSLHCGAVAYGGRMAENEIVVAPTGILVQHPSTYKGINAVPSHKRDTFEFLCARNSVVGCAKDGIAISAAGTFDGNGVSHCKTGITLAPCSGGNGSGSGGGGGGGGGCPLVKNCSVYDNTVGICIEHEAEAVVRDNDVFDNEMVGVVVAATATGTLQGNHISSAMDQGAVEIPTEARLKAIGNVIRNQFSPAFQRGTRGSRAKDHQVEQANLDRELRDLDDAVDAAHESVDATASAMRTLQRRLVDMHSRSIADSPSVIAGAAGSALRAASAAAAATAAGKTGGAAATAAGGVGAAAKKDGRPTSATRTASGAPAANTETKSGGAALAGRRATSGGSRRAPVAASAARKSSKTTASAAGTSATAKAGGDPKQVLVHVFANADTSSGANAIGQAITGVLAKAPLSKYSFVSSISTSTSQLQQLLTGPRAIQPFICVVVLDAHFHDLSQSDRAALQQLHNSAGGASHPLSAPPPQTRRGSGSGEPSRLYYTVVPSSLRARGEATETEGGGMSVEAFAAAHHAFTYAVSIEEVLDILHDQISEDVRVATTTAPAVNSRSRRSISTALEDSATDSAFSNGGGDGDTDGTDSGAPSLNTGPLNTTGRAARGGATGPTALTTEYVGALLSQLTPEALGFEPAKTSRQVKKRKSSVAMGAEEEADAAGAPLDGTRRTQRGSAQARRTSTALKASGPTPATTRRRSSVTGAKSTHRGSIVSKKN
ncbi:Periplasmic copper-binding protein [Novymonas esmeraldas]|uniref:Periplasmic copper-binding protein n=1 Tax=Novymonas esmeraldas TaxID=1808958 RepID=A0AAW0F6W0_9TRYP